MGRRRKVLLRGWTHLDEAIVEGQVVPQGVLPSSRVLPVVREAVSDEFVNLGERQHLVPRGPYRHRRKRYVGVRRFLITVGVARGPRHHQRERRDQRDTEAQCVSIPLLPLGRRHTWSLARQHPSHPCPSDPTTGTRGRPRRSITITG